MFSGFLGLVWVVVEEELAEGFVCCPNVEDGLMPNGFESDPGVEIQARDFGSGGGDVRCILVASSDILDKDVDRSVSKGFAGRG